MDGIVEAVTEFASLAGEKLGQQGSVAGALQVFIRTSPLRHSGRLHSPCTMVPLRPTADSRRLVGAACEAARAMFWPGFKYDKEDVMLLDMQDHATAHQQAELDLFAEPQGDAG